MPWQFTALPAEPPIVEQLARLTPENAFATVEFFESRKLGGWSAWVIGVSEGGTLVHGCGAFLRAGLVSRTLEIPSLPTAASDGAFRDGLREFCHSHGITWLELGTFASAPGTSVPAVGGECSRRPRCEFSIDLGIDLERSLSANHKRNVKRAAKASVTVTRTRAPEAAVAHRLLMGSSMERRKSRGENVNLAVASPEDLAYLNCGAGELFQAVQGTTVLSSVLVLRAAQGGYYQSAGTSERGMALGASHFLIHTISTQLRADGARSFNLGGADPDTGLGRFKEGFGSSRIGLEATGCRIDGWRSRVVSVVSALRAIPTRVRDRLNEMPTRLIVYATNPAENDRPTARDDLAFRALSAQDLGELSGGDPSFRLRQLDRVQRFGASYAYGVFVGDEIAHISWLLPPDAIVRDTPRVFKPRSDEAEITCCETKPGFRGKGIYGFAIRNLLDIARQQGVRRVYMKTTVDNVASQAGIMREGLTRIGLVLIIRSPVLGRLVVIRNYR